MRLNERKELHNISQTRVSKWPNTIQAERERKEYERIKKLEDDEVSQPNQILKLDLTLHLTWLELV